MLVQLSIHGIIPFHMAIYSLWQYALIVHIITVLIIAILRVRAENRQLEQKQRPRANCRLSVKPASTSGSLWAWWRTNFAPRWR